MYTTAKLPLSNAAVTKNKINEDTPPDTDNDLLPIAAIARKGVTSTTACMVTDTSPNSYITKYPNTANSIKMLSKPFTP